MNEFYCFISKKAGIDGAPMMFLCQTRLSETQFAFHWKLATEVGETEETREQIYTFTEIDPKQIDPIIDSALAKGFAVWLAKGTEDGDFEYTPIGFRKELK